MATGTASLPLHGGSAPRWLFERMEQLGGAMAGVIIDEYGREELLKRLSDPYWFQAFGCVLGFDWHSSGLTTTTMGALKEALDPAAHGVTVAGGKGAASRRTPDELVALEEQFNLRSADVARLQRHSRLAAAVDDSCVQDPYDLYHHTFIVTEDGDWCVVQQGMGDDLARRYHWHHDTVASHVDDPQNAVCSTETHPGVRDLSAAASAETRQVSLDLVNDDPRHLQRYARDPAQHGLDTFSDDGTTLTMPRHHELRQEDLSERAIRQLQEAYEVQPEDYEELVAVEGVGERSLRALAMIAELVHGTASQWEDPAKYAYAHGGKDGTPEPVDRERYDESIRHVQQALHQADIDGKEERQALRRLADLTA